MSVGSNKCLFSLGSEFLNHLDKVVSSLNVVARVLGDRGIEEAIFSDGVDLVFCVVDVVHDDHLVCIVPNLIRGCGRDTSSMQVDHLGHHQRDGRVEVCVVGCIFRIVSITLRCELMRKLALRTVHLLKVLVRHLLKAVISHYHSVTLTELHLSHVLEIEYDT